MHRYAFGYSLYAWQMFAMARCFLFLLLIANVALLPAQVDTSLVLSEVTVTASRFRAGQLGNQVLEIDSSSLVLSPSRNLADVLQQHTTVFIKSYGLGSLATSSIRGAGASHTAIVWNGFQIRSPMLGQLDLALLPAVFIDEAQVQFGGNSALWGSGAVGGVIQLDNKIRFDQGWRLSLQNQTGSFGQWHHDARVHFSNHNFASTTRIFHQTAKNDFPYRIRPDAPERRQSNAAFRQTGILQENRIKLSPRQQVGVRLWLQRAGREIPPTTTQSFSVAEQEDEALRATLDWQYLGDQIIWQARTGIFGESIHFRDSIGGVDARSHSWTSISEAEGQWQLNAEHSFNFGINYTHTTGTADGYSDGKVQNQTALFVAHHWENQSGLRTRLSLRQGLADGAFLPIIPALGIEQDVTPWLLAKASVTRNYRLPTFNDLYWNPGGNPDLKPEDGWSQELGLESHFQTKTGKLSYSVTAFNRNIRDWIMWQPGDFFWSPQNVAKVWSRGLEQRLNYQSKINNIQFKISAGYDWIRSTNQQINREAAIGKQLIYVPDYQAFGNVSLTWQGVHIAYQHQYVGEVFTRSDNTAWLPAYQLGFLDLRYRADWQKFSGSLFFRVNNLWDAEYRAIENRRMPGRSFQAGFSFDFKQK